MWLNLSKRGGQKFSRQLILNTIHPENIYLTYVPHSSWKSWHVPSRINEMIEVDSYKQELWGCSFYLHYQFYIRFLPFHKFFLYNFFKFPNYINLLNFLIPLHGQNKIFHSEIQQNPISFSSPLPLWKPQYQLRRGDSANEFCPIHLIYLMKTILSENLHI